MVGPNAIGTNSLLDSQPKKGSLLVSHKSQSSSSAGVVILSTLETCRPDCVAAAAVHTDRPEVVGARSATEGIIGTDDRSNAIELVVSEAHGFAEVDVCTRLEEHPTGIHELLPMVFPWIHTRVAAQIVDTIERLHSVVEVVIARKACQAPCNQGCEEQEDIPRWLITCVSSCLEVLGTCPYSLERFHAYPHHKTKRHEHDEEAHEGQLVVQFEGYQVEEEAKQKPWDEEADEDCHEIESPSAPIEIWRLDELITLYHAAVGRRLTIRVELLHGWTHQALSLLHNRIKSHEWGANRHRLDRRCLWLDSSTPELGRLWSYSL